MLNLKGVVYFTGGTLAFGSENEDSKEEEEEEEEEEDGKRANLSDDFI